MDEQRIRNPGIAFLLSQLGAQTAREWTTRLAAEGLEPREVMLFRFVALAEGHSQSEVSRAIGLPASRIVALVDRLEERGWVERRPGSRDRRSHALHVTPKGHAIIAKVTKISARFEADVSQGLDPVEQATLKDLLGRIAAAQGLTEGVHPGFADTAVGDDGHGADPADSG